MSTEKQKMEDKIVLQSIQVFPLLYGKNKLNISIENII